MKCLQELQAFFNDYDLMKSKSFFFIGLISALGLMVCCFLPWTHYTTVNLTFNGFNVVRFATGNYYGKAGYAILFFSIILVILQCILRLWAKRLAVFLAAVLAAYCLRTFIIFTSGLVEGDVQKLPGIYFLLILSVVLFISTLFPYIPAGRLEQKKK